jgi:hypothetical protein
MRRIVVGISIFTVAAVSIIIYIGMGAAANRTRNAAPKEQHATQSAENSPQPSIPIGRVVALKIPTYQVGVILETSTNGILICVPDASGGVKTQLISPALIENR